MAAEYHGYGNWRPGCNCRACKRERRMRLCHSKVSRAIRSGLLPDLKRGAVQCSDCQRQADRYDHRDYSRPFEVFPVCHRCNAKRGPAKNDLRNKLRPDVYREAA